MNSAFPIEDPKKRGAARARVWYWNHIEDPVFRTRLKGYQRKAIDSGYFKKYYRKKRSDPVTGPAYLERIRLAQRAHYEKIKADPIKWAEFLRKDKIRQARRRMDPVKALRIKELAKLSRIRRIQLKKQNELQQNNPIG